MGYVKFIDTNTIQYPTAAEFPGVVNWQQHDGIMRAHEYFPLTGKPEQKSGKVLKLDTFALHTATKQRKEAYPVVVEDYEDDPEHPGEKRKTGEHTEWRERTVTVDDSTVSVETYHYEDIVPSVEEARAQKLAELDAWDNAELPDKGINWFTVMHGGQPLHVWIKKTDRAALMLTMQAAEAEGRSLISVWAGGVELQLPIPQGRDMLLAVESFASACYVVTAGHRKAISELTDAQEILAYDFKAGYPEHPVFDFANA